MNASRRRGVVVWNGKFFLVVATALALGACSQSKPRDDVPVSIVATDSGYVVPDTLHEGLNHIVFENHGSTIHECMFIRLPDGLEPDEYLAAVRAGSDFPEGAVDCSGPGLTSPLQRVELWVSLAPGRYLLACWFLNHLTRMAPHTIVVDGAPQVPGTPPREDVTVKLVDFRFELDGPIRRGMQTIRVETVGPSMHEIDIFRLDGGRNLADLRAWYAARLQDGGPATLMGGVLDSHEIPHVVWLRREFTVGHYVMWCGMPMIQSGNVAEADSAAHVTHADAGMVLEFDVEL
jgi:hypothetical protein